jgi:predicted transcriptional regulator
MIEKRRITLVRINNNVNDSVNILIQEFGRSLGLFTQRDKESSCFRIFIDLLKSHEDKISSQELAFRSGLTRGTVVHHLNRLIEEGLVVVEKNRYFLCADNLKNLVANIERDSNRIIANMKKIAEKVDEELGI